MKTSPTNTVGVYARALVMLTIAVSAASCATFSGMQTVNTRFTSVGDGQASPYSVDLVWVYAEEAANTIGGATNWFSEKPQILSAVGSRNVDVRQFEIVPLVSLTQKLKMRGRPVSFFLFIRSSDMSPDFFVRRYDGKSAQFKQIEITLRNSGIEVTAK